MNFENSSVVVFYYNLDLAKKSLLKFMNENNIRGFTQITESLILQRSIYSTQASSEEKGIDQPANALESKPEED